MENGKEKGEETPVEQIESLMQFLWKALTALGVVWGVILVVLQLFVWEKSFALLFLTFTVICIGTVGSAVILRRMEMRLHREALKAAAEGTGYRLAEDRAKAFLTAAVPLVAAFLFLTEYSRETVAQEKAHQLEVRRRNEEYSRMDAQGKKAAPQKPAEDGDSQTDGDGEGPEPE